MRKESLLGKPKHRRRNNSKWWCRMLSFQEWGKCQWILVLATWVNNHLTNKWWWEEATCLILLRWCYINNNNSNNSKGCKTVWELCLNKTSLVVYLSKTMACQCQWVRCKGCKWWTNNSLRVNFMEVEAFTSSSNNLHLKWDSISLLLILALKETRCLI